MTGQRAFLERLVRYLEEIGIEFMVSGSIASSFHGEPRATRDVDLVIDCSRTQLTALLDAIQRLGWYVNADTALAALDERTMFNLIAPDSGWKADLIVRKARGFSACEFERRTSAQIFGPGSMPMMISTPEDTILAKLEWARAARSEQQYRDALAIAMVGATRIDRDYLRRWADELGVSTTLDQLLAEADQGGSGTSAAPHADQGEQSDRSAQDD